MTQEPLVREQDDWPWPFSKADLSAGLRRYYEDPTIWVEGVRPLTLAHIRPSIGRLRAAVIDFSGDESSGTCRLIVKEPRGTTRTGLAGAGRREVGMYRYLANEMPMQSPQMIAGSAAGDWLVMEEVRPVRTAADWNSDDYETAIRSLVELHDRFWGLSDDLSTFPWLSRPLDADFEVHVAAAANSLEQVTNQGKLSNWPDHVHTMAHLIMNAGRVIAPLLAQPATLLHGDYWPGNISVVENDRQVVYDWQLAAVGPPVLDLVAFVKKSEWWFGDSAPERERIVKLYRERLARASGVRWEEEIWQEIWEHALMWRFLQEWMDLLAASPKTLLEAQSQQLERVWFEPLTNVVARRLM